MKRIIFILTMVLFPLMANAQTPEFKKFYKVYDNRDGYTTIMMSGDMFSSLQRQSGSSNQTISNIFVVTVENPSTQFKNDVAELVLNPAYDLKTSINDDNEKIRIYVNKKGDKIVEILMTIQEDDEMVVMSVTGQNLNINSVAQMADKIDDQIDD